MQISDGYIYQISLWGIPFPCDLFIKRIDQKNVLLWQQITELIVLASRWSVKYFFAYSGKAVEKWRRRKPIMKLFAFQANISQSLLFGFLFFNFLNFYGSGVVRNYSLPRFGWVICKAGASKIWDSLTQKKLPKFMRAVAITTQSWRENYLHLYKLHVTNLLKLINASIFLGPSSWNWWVQVTRVIQHTILRISDCLIPTFEVFFVTLLYSRILIFISSY